MQKAGPQPEGIFQDEALEKIDVVTLDRHHLRRAELLKKLAVVAFKGPQFQDRHPFKSMRKQRGDPMHPGVVMKSYFRARR